MISSSYVRLIYFWTLKSSCSSCPGKGPSRACTSGGHGHTPIETIAGRSCPWSHDHESPLLVCWKLIFDHGICLASNAPRPDSSQLQLDIRRTLIDHSSLWTFWWETGVISGASVALWWWTTPEFSPENYGSSPWSFSHKWRIVWYFRTGDWLSSPLWPH